MIACVCACACNRDTNNLYVMRRIKRNYIIPNTKLKTNQKKCHNEKIDDNTNQINHHWLTDYLTINLGSVNCIRSSIHSNDFGTENRHISTFKSLRQIFMYSLFSYDKILFFLYISHYDYHVSEKSRE